MQISDLRTALDQSIENAITVSERAVALKDPDTIEAAARHINNCLDWLEQINVIPKNEREHTNTKD